MKAFIYRKKKKKKKKKRVGTYYFLFLAHANRERMNISSLLELIGFILFYFFILAEKNKLKIL
jgi:hypothetical protein